MAKKIYESGILPGRKLDGIRSRIRTLVFHGKWQG